MIKQECHCKIGRYCLLKYASIMYHVIYENVCSECYERFEDTKGVTGSPRLKKNKQCNFQRKKGQKDKRMIYKKIDRNLKIQVLRKVVNDLR